MPVNKVLEATPPDGRRTPDTRADRKMGQAARGAAARSASLRRLSICGRSSSQRPWSPESDILFERRGAAGIVTLNRPKALNAVTHDMVRALARQLDAWAR